MSRRLLTATKGNTHPIMIVKAFLYPNNVSHIIMLETIRIMQHRNCCSFMLEPFFYFAHVLPIRSAVVPAGVTSLVYQFGMRQRAAWYHWYVKFQNGTTLIMKPPQPFKPLSLVTLLVEASGQSEGNEMEAFILDFLGQGWAVS